MNKIHATNRCIIFFGPDGSGKTTHSNLLTNFLKKKGRRVSSVRIRANHTVSFVLLRLMQKLGFIKKNLLFEGLNPTLAKKMAKLWPFIEFASIVPLVILRVGLPLKLGFTVVCERYVVDTIVSVAYLFNNPQLVNGITEKILLGFIPKGAIIVHLTAQESLLLKRRRDEPVTRGFLHFQIQMYNEYAEKLKAVSFDTTTKDRKHIQEAISAQLVL